MKVIDLFFPQSTRCVFCGSEDCKYNICDECFASLPFIKSPTCIRCGGRVLPEEIICQDCAQVKHLVDVNYSILDYDDFVKSKIISFKQNKKRKIGVAFAHIVKEYYDALHLDIDVIVPVPIHTNRLKERGFNQSEILASKLGEKVNTHILERIKDTPHQTGLSRKNRRENLDRSFSVVDKSKVKGKNILLVDDIYTTGSTLDECASTLYKCGAKSVQSLCLARGLVYPKRLLNNN